MFLIVINSLDWSIQRRLGGTISFPTCAIINGQQGITCPIRSKVGFWPEAAVRCAAAIRQQLAA